MEVPRFNFDEVQKCVYTLWKGNTADIERVIEAAKFWLEDNMDGQNLVISFTDAYWNLALEATVDAVHYLYQIPEKEESTSILIIDMISMIDYF